MFKRLFWIMLLVPAFADWDEVRSPHFKVITNAGVNNGRVVAQDFEQIYRVFDQLFPGLNQSTSKDLVIVAVSGKTINGLLTELGQPFNRPLAGMFKSGMLRNHIIVAVDDLQAAKKSILHDYAHLVVSGNFTLPLWLEEGLACYLNQLEFQGDRVHIGKVDDHVRVLLTEPMLPLEQMAGVDQDSPMYDETNRASAFSAQSWLLTHYALMSPEGRKSKLFNQLVSYGELPPARALERAGGDLSALQQALQNYLADNRFPFITIETGSALDAEAFPATSLSASQASSYKLLMSLSKTGESIAPTVLAELEAHQTEAGLALNLALILMQLQKSQEAVKLLQRNALLMPQDWLYNYLMSFDIKLKATLQRRLLEKSLAEKPNFAQAAYRLALLLKYDETQLAIQYAQQAIKADPSATGYRLLLSDLKARLNSPAQGEVPPEQPRVLAREWDERVFAAGGISQYERPKPVVKPNQGSPSDASALTMVYRRDLLYTTPLLKALWQKATDQELDAHLAQAPQERSLYGETALHLAVELGRDRVVEKLLTKGSDRDARDTGQWTPLTLAAANNFPKLAARLIDAGAKLDSANEFGQTPLMWACFHGQSELVKRLLAKGADRERQDKTGHSALDYVDHKQHKELYRLLRDFKLRKGQSGPLSPQERTELPQARAQAMRRHYTKQSSALTSASATSSRPARTSARPSGELAQKLDERYREAEATQDTDKALALLDQLLAAEPGYEPAHLLKIQLLCKQGQASSALEAVTSYAQVASDTHILGARYLDVAILFYDRGVTAENSATILDCLHNAWRGTAGTQPLVQFYLGMVYFVTGEKELALAAFQTYLDSNDQSTKRVLAVEHLRSLRELLHLK